MKNESTRKTLTGTLSGEGNDNFYKKLVENSAHAIMIAAKDPLQLIYVSPGMEKIAGYTPTEMTYFTPKQINELIHPDDRETFFGRFYRALNNKPEQKKLEFRIIHQSGETKWVELFPSLITINNKKSLQGTFIDITARKKAELKIIENEKRYRTLIKLAPDAFFHGDNSGNFIDANRNSTILTGYTRKELLGMKMNQLYAPEDLQDSPLRYDKLQKGLTVTSERIVMRKDGTRIVVEMKSLMLPDKTHISLFRDISKRKKLERELIAAKIKAEESDKLKTEFLNNMSHEIRTPLNAIIGFSTLLTDNEEYESEKRLYCSIIEESGNQLMMIISDIIDISKIEAGQIVITRNKFNLNHVIDQLHSTFSHSSQLKVPLISNKALPDERSVVVSDKYRLIQVFSNLISNAIKFTTQGTISFGYEVEAENLIYCFVKDTGRGIDPRFHNEIFNRFHQIHPSGSLKAAGTGLGLAIAKGLVNMLGGEIIVESAENDGSLFYFKIPVSLKLTERDGLAPIL